MKGIPKVPVMEVVLAAPAVAPEGADVGIINLKSLYFQDGGCRHLPSPVNGLLANEDRLLQAQLSGSHSQSSVDATWVDLGNSRGHRHVGPKPGFN